MNRGNQARTRPAPAGQSGVAMIEVLFTVFILLVGVLGLGALQLNVANANVEAYQRAQAIVLLNDMVERFTSTRYVQTCYNFSSSTTGFPYVGQPYGTADTHLLSPTTSTVPCSSSSDATINTMPAAELNSWSEALKGASETSTANAKVGALSGARGCIYSSTDTTVTPNQLVYTFALAWQGTNDTFAPPSNAPCASGTYGSESKRRVVWTTVRVAGLN